MNRSQRRSSPAHLSRIADAIPADENHIRARMLAYFRSKPHLQHTTKEIALFFGVHPNNAWNHMKQLLHEGAIEKVPNKKIYQAAASYKTLEEKRQMALEAGKARIQHGEEWRHGAQGVALVMQPSYKYMQRHLASIRSRMVLSMAPEDVETFDEVVKLAFPSDTKKGPA